MVNYAYIALGSNLNLEGCSPKELLKQGIAELNKSDLQAKSISRFFKNPAFPIGSGPDFVNAAIKVRTHEKAQNVMNQLHAIEQKFGRSRKKRWGERTLDLDLIAFGRSIKPNKSIYFYWHNLNEESRINEAPCDLILPHPRMHERVFVLIPMLDIAPDWIHPVLMKNTSQLCDDLSNEEISELTCV
tara:strand:- start:477 stop:1037 length:561 start_codon:yes stop_codon:yes gene_type:complete